MKPAPWINPELPGAVRVRFAPSPTGELHIGGARTALFNAMLARSAGGVFILRIEDTDAARSTEENTQVILDGLRWLGLSWDEGPEIGGPCEPYFQSQRGELYAAAMDHLMAAGMVYPCFLTQDELQEMKAKAEAAGLAVRQESPYRDANPEEVRERVAKGEPHTIRLRCPDGEIVVNDLLRGEVRFDARQTVGDFILRRSDGGFTYNFVVVVDDLSMGITHVLRGDDHLSNTPKQAVVMRALGGRIPVYAHVPLIHGMDGKKLSKRHGAASVLEYQRDGYLPQAVVNFTALLGWHPGTEDEVQPLEELIKRFKLEDLRTSAARFDFDKLQWMNGVYIRQMPEAAYLKEGAKWLQEAGIAASEEGRDREILLALWERIKTFKELPDLARFFYEDQPPDEKALKALTQEGLHPVLVALLEVIEAQDLTDETAVESALRELLDRLGEKPKKVFQALRAAVTGRLESPPLFLTLRLIGKETVVRRLSKAAGFSSGQELAAE